MVGVADMLSLLRSRGITLTVENAQLRYRAPHGAVSAQEVEWIRARKVEIIELLGREDAVVAEPPLVSSPERNCVPLTFAQQWWWDCVSLMGSAGNVQLFNMRHCTHSMRISGPLNIESLCRSLEALVRRHESLRIRIVMTEERLTQEINEPRLYELEIIDLSGSDAERSQIEARRRVEEFMYEPVGPLFAARLLRLADDDHVLAVGMSHAIIDATSMQILLSDLLRFYAHAQAGTLLALPRIPLQYADYAIWQRRSEPWWTNTHGRYWRERLHNARRIECPLDADILKEPKVHSLRVRVAFDPRVIANLRELSRRAHTSLPIAVMTAYAAVVLRWQGGNDGVIRFMVDGRVRLELQDMVGYLSTFLCLRVQLSADQTFIDLLQQASVEYRRAYEHYDFGRMSIPGMGFTHALSVNWRKVPEDTKPASPVPDPGAGGAGDSLSVRPFQVTSFRDMRFPYDARTPAFDPMLEIDEWGDAVSGELLYRSDLFRTDTMERLAKSLCWFTERVVESPRARVVSLTRSLWRG